MARTDRDSWDLASSVGATATMVAAARAAATRRPDPVINDPFAEPLVRAVGLDLFTKVASGELDFADVDDDGGFPRMVDTFAARARFYDDYLAEAGKAGVRQVVIVASGLDARPYRLSWPTGTTLYEIDHLKRFYDAQVGDASAAKVEIHTRFNDKQQVFLDFVLSHYVQVGVEELDQEKLRPLLLLKYHNAIADAVADLGMPEEIGKVFAGFQKYLYQRAA